MTQYLESDFAFINRLCEEEGIWYAFEQYGQHGDVVVFGDSPEHYFRDQSLPVSYRPHAGLESTGTEALFNLSIRHNPIVEGIRSADYNYRTVDTDLFAERDGGDPRIMMKFGADRAEGTSRSEAEILAIWDTVLPTLKPVK